jgi:hypothetical protein
VKVGGQVLNCQYSSNMSEGGGSGLELSVFI